MALEDKAIYRSDQVSDASIAIIAWMLLLRRLHYRIYMRPYREPISRQYYAAIHRAPPSTGMILLRPGLVKPTASRPACLYLLLATMATSCREISHRTSSNLHRPWRPYRHCRLVMLVGIDIENGVAAILRSPLGVPTRNRAAWRLRERTPPFDFVRE